LSCSHLNNSNHKKKKSFGSEVNLKGKRTILSIE